MSLLQPLYLWALLGLSVPLAIHLLSRKEGKVIRMGSLRHIRETSSRQFKSIRLNELLLLALRSIVIGLITMLMSGWYLNELKDKRKWVILEPGVESKPTVISIRDSLRAAGYEERYLGIDFPKLDETIVRTEQLDYLARIEDLDALSLDSVVVIATNRSVGFNGSRMSLPLNFRWIVVNAAVTEFEVSRSVMSTDSIFLRVGKSTSARTSFSSYKVPRVNESSNARTTKAQPEINQIMKITVASDEGFEMDSRILLAALDAIRAGVPGEIQVTSVATSSAQPNFQTDWLFWLSEEEPPPINGKIMICQQRFGSSLIVQQEPHLFLLTGRLNSEVLINQNVTPQLMRMLFPGKEEWLRAKASDVRMVDDKVLWSKANIGGAPLVAAVSNQTSTRYLLIALLLFIVLERIVSYKRNQ